MNRALPAALTGLDTAERLRLGHESVKDINESGTRLLALINDILDLSKIEASKVTLHEEAFDVFKAVGSCLNLVKERAETAGVNLKSEIASGLPPLYTYERMLK